MLRKHLTKFDTDNDYKKFVFSNNVINPNISLINTNRTLNFGIVNEIYTINDVKTNKQLFENCEFFYEDINKSIILNFKSLNYDEVISFNEYNIVPYLAKYIGIYINNVRVGELNIDLLIQNFGERKYRVGLMTDIHYSDDTIDSENGVYKSFKVDFESDLINALNLYQNKEDVKFICAAGDLTSNNIIHLLNFKKSLDIYAPTTNFYSCFGNHDFASVKNENIIENEIGYNTENITPEQAWNNILTPNNSEYELHYQDDTTELGKSSYWFEVPIEGTNKSDIYLFLSVNYNNEDSVVTTQLTNDTPYLQELIDYVGFMPSKYNLQFYDNQTLLWLKNILEQFSNKRIFIFTHLFLVHKAGSNNVNYNYFSYGGIGDRWRMGEELAYCPCGIQFEFLNKLNNEYKNTIWLSGHSHLKWNWQTIDPNVNINDNEYNIYRPDDSDFVNDMQYLRKTNDPISKTGFNVHLPSTCCPLKISQWYDPAGEDSEGAIMDIYEDYVDIRGIVFKEGGDEYINKYYPLAQYRINIKAA